MSHRIVAIHFRPKSDSQEAPLTCECGWSGRVADYPAHREATTGSKSGHHHALGPTKPSHPFRLHVRRAGALAK